jgi:hypothetical protein
MLCSVFPADSGLENDLAVSIRIISTEDAQELQKCSYKFLMIGCPLNRTRTGTAELCSAGQPRAAVRT